VATAGAVLITLQRNPDLPLILPLLACIGVAVAIGLLNGTIITKAGLPPFIVTLAIGIFFRSITTYMNQGTTIMGRNVPEFTRLGMGNIGAFPVPFVIFVTSAVILSCVLKYTKFGSYVYAVGGNENAARYSGINVHLVKIGAYALLGVCIGLCAIVDFGRTVAVTTTTSGYLYEFDAITAVVIGGTSLAGGRGRILGTVMGVFIIGMVSNILIMLNLSPLLQGAVKGIIILVAVLLQKKDR
jgi:ribose transport system permease protein